MLLVIGIFLIVVGISDYGIAALLARQQASATGGLGASEPPAARILRRTGALTIVIGAVLVVIGLVA